MAAPHGIGLRYWPTRRRVLRVRGEYNPKTLRREKTIVDKRPIWWLLGLLVLALGPLFTPLGVQNTLLTAASTFAIYAAISLCWMLIIGTAGIFSLASYAVVGTAAFCTAYLSISFGVPWWLLPPIGAVVGLIFGGIIALPATRLDGFYYALLTLGLNELCRVYFTTSPVFGAANGGLFGARHLHSGLCFSARSAPDQLLCLLRRIAAGAAVLPADQRSAAGTNIAHGAGETRSVCRSDRRELPPGPCLGVRRSLRPGWALSADFIPPISAASRSRYSTSTPFCSVSACW